MVSGGYPRGLEGLTGLTPQPNDIDINILLELCIHIANDYEYQSRHLVYRFLRNKLTSHNYFSKLQPLKYISNKTMNLFF